MDAKEYLKRLREESLSQEEPKVESKKPYESYLEKLRKEASAQAPKKETKVEPQKKEEVKPKDKEVPEWVQNVQMGLDVAGMVPVIGNAADLANAGIYAWNEDYGNAALSAAAALPIVGQAAGGAKLAKTAVKAGQKALKPAKKAGWLSSIGKGFDYLGKVGTLASVAPAVYDWFSDDDKEKEGGKISSLFYKHGGIIVGGVGHDESNNIGDRGVPVIPIEDFAKGGKYKKTNKVAEIEDAEIIFNRQTAKDIDKLVDEYDDCGCDMKLVALGKIIKDAVYNLEDKNCERADKCELTSKLNKNV